jgi:hypothetical protein
MKNISLSQFNLPMPSGQPLRLTGDTGVDLKRTFVCLVSWRILVSQFPRPAIISFLKPSLG